MITLVSFQLNIHVEESRHREAKIQITESGLLEWDESTIRSEIGQDLKEKIENSPFFRSSRLEKN